MPNRRSFLITLHKAEGQNRQLCGRLEKIQSGQAVNFTSAEELIELLQHNVCEESGVYQVNQNSDAQSPAPAKAASGQQP